uniref:Ascorbate-dependent monooxygenase n=1 Tax=Solibacter usitatus (strain Ellin6076) TaxID=234267 RepID=Q020N9_SOLUE
MPFAGILAAFLLAAPAPNFSHDVAPLLYRRCAACHHTGGVAPFPLLTYDEVRKRAGLIATVTSKKYMPPWLPSAPKFLHEAKLSGAEIAMLAAWAAAGAPEGDRHTAPAPPTFSDAWTLGAPDLEAAMPHEFHIPADGPDLYQCFVIPAPAAQNHWVRALDIRPGNSKVVHHVILFQDTSHTARKRDQGAGYPCFGTPGFLPARGLGGWTPGAAPAQKPDDIPDLLHGGADLVLQVHYHPTGKPETDRTRLALYFTPNAPKRRLMDVALGSSRIDIPPGDSSYKVTDHFTVPVAVDILGVIPHAHYICKSMNAWAVLPDGSQRTLLSIPAWNFDWQQQYRYPAPVHLPEDSRIEMEFVYDNSAANPRNPNHPPARVTVGPATTDEMAGLHLETTPTNPGDADELSQALWGKMMRSLGGGIYRPDR